MDQNKLLSFRFGFTYILGTQNAYTIGIIGNLWKEPFFHTTKTVTGHRNRIYGWEIEIAHPTRISVVYYF